MYNRMFKLMSIFNIVAVSALCLFGFSFLTSCSTNETESEILYYESVTPTPSPSPTPTPTPSPTPTPTPSPTPSPTPTPTPTPAMESLGTFTCTGYCACTICCGAYAEGITASGVKVHYDKDGETTCAVDPSVIPLGTLLYIDGQYYRAEDTGSAVKGKIVDLYFETHDEASAYGSQKHEVFIVYE